MHWPQCQFMRVLSGRQSWLIPRMCPCFVVGGSWMLTAAGTKSGIAGPSSSSVSRGTSFRMRVCAPVLQMPQAGTSTRSLLLLMLRTVVCSMYPWPSSGIPFDAYILMWIVFSTLVGSPSIAKHPKSGVYPWRMLFTYLLRLSKIVLANTVAMIG